MLDGDKYKVDNLFWVHWQTQLSGWDSQLLKGDKVKRTEFGINVKIRLALVIAIIVFFFREKNKTDLKRNFLS